MTKNDWVIEGSNAYRIVENDPRSHTMIAIQANPVDIKVVWADYESQGVASQARATYFNLGDLAKLIHKHTNWGEATLSYAKLGLGLAPDDQIEELGVVAVVREIGT